jgi:hypothetical protein
VRICGTDCTNLQDLLRANFALALDVNAVPKAVRLHLTNCTDQPAPDAGAPITDAGPG